MQMQLCVRVCVCVHYMRINCIRNTQRIDNCDALLSRSCSKPAKVGNAFLSDNARVCECVCVSMYACVRVVIVAAVAAMCPIGCTQQNTLNFKCGTLAHTFSAVSKRARESESVSVRERLCVRESVCKRARLCESASLTVLAPLPAPHRCQRQRLYPPLAGNIAVDDDDARVGGHSRERTSKYRIAWHAAAPPQKLHTCWHAAHHQVEYFVPPLAMPS